MSLFRWLSGKPPQTKLEKFCGTLSVERVARAFMDQPNSQGLIDSYSLLLLSSANQFLENAIKQKLVGARPNQVRPNVVLFEVATFLWCVVHEPIMRWADDEMELSKDGEITSQITVTRECTYRLMGQYWPNVDLEAVGRSRLYNGGPLQCGAQLSEWIVSSAGSEVPATTMTKPYKVEINHLPVWFLGCQQLAQNVAPHVFQTLQRCVEFLVEARDNYMP